MLTYGEEMRELEFPAKNREGVAPKQSNNASRVKNMAVSAKRTMQGPCLL